VHRGIVWIVWSPITRIDLFETAGFYARASCFVTARANANQLRVSDESTSRENLRRDKNYFRTITAAAYLPLRVLVCSRLGNFIAPNQLQFSSNIDVYVTFDIIVYKAKQ